jgi:hypothetical protein
VTTDEETLNAEGARPSRRPVTGIKRMKVRNTDPPSSQ